MIFFKGWLILIIGTIKEIKNNENRIGLTPSVANKLVEMGNTVFVESKAGDNAGFSDAEYLEAGAKMFDEPEEIAKQVDILVKVKEPLASEYPLLGLMQGKTLYTYLHLASCDKDLTLELMKNKITSIAYETVEKNGSLPLLAPMSEVAGVLAIQYGAHYLQKKYHGRGVTLSTIEGTQPATVVVVGAGAVGAKSALTAAGMGCNVIVLEKNAGRIYDLKQEFKISLGPRAANVTFEISDDETLSAAVKKADLLVGGVLVPGAKAPKVVQERHVGMMKRGAVIVDVAIDQGGCVWGSKPTSHDDPIYEIDGKIFCCITNMPGQVALQSTQALNAATSKYLYKMADQGIISALKDDDSFAKGVNVYDGKVVCQGVADALALDYSVLALD